MTESLKNQLRQLADVDFPAAAKSGAYPVRFNHCFLRIVYDNLLGGRWQDKLAKGKPAIHQLNDQQLREAIALGQRLIDDPELTRELNVNSLRWRGKLR